MGNGFKACGHIEVNSGCNFAQVAQCFMHEGWRGFAVVDVHRTAMKHHHAKVVIATKGVVPWQPVDQDQRGFGQDGHGLRHLLLIGTPQTLCVDHGFRQLGGATGEQKFHNGVRACGCNGRIDLRCGGGAAQSCKCCDLFAFYATFVHHNFHVTGNCGRNGFCIACVAGKHQAWRHGAQHVLEFVVVLTNQ